jgi:hypothetical protein
MPTARHHLSKLIRRDGAFCHYCKVGLIRSQATRDHVVPRSLGGPNSLSNFVLCCDGCNQKRGTDLDWCNCNFCGPLIAAYRNSDAYMNQMFLEIAKFNKPAVKYRTKMWKVYLHGNMHCFRTWEDAMDFATNYERVRNGFQYAYR